MRKVYEDRLRLRLRTQTKFNLHSSLEILFSFLRYLKRMKAKSIYFFRYFALNNKNI